MTIRPAFIAASALAALTISCAPHARVGMYGNVPGPPGLAFETDPYFVPLPGTYAYAVPDYDIDLYYADGYYWRPWQGRWYQSTHYNRGWVSFAGVPRFYSSIPNNWRNDYRSNRWRGRSWDYARVPRHEVEQNWSTWKRERRWDDDQRRYTGDRRWHDDGRQSGRRDWDDRDGNRRGDTDRREQSRPVTGPDRRDDGRVYERREGERRTYDARQPVERRSVEPRTVDVQRRDAQRRAEEPRVIERREAVPVRREAAQPRPAVERRTIERREAVPVRREVAPQPRPAVQERRTIERREAVPVRREVTPQPRPAVQERRTIERQQVAPASRAEGRDVPPRRRGPVAKDENRDGIDDSLQRQR
ncbi:MAG: hypothetical protein ABR587_12580 [Candidatus Binatia bacterium]